MKLASLLTLTSLAVSAAFAQSIEIGYPHVNTRISPGEKIVVQVIRPVRILPSSAVLALALR
jgi:hypothetical protein